MKPQEMNDPKNQTTSNETTTRRRFSIAEVSEPIGSRVISLVDKYLKPSELSDEKAKKRLYRMFGLAVVAIFTIVMRFTIHVLFTNQYQWSLLFTCFLWVFMVHHNRHQTEPTTSFSWGMIGAIPSLLFTPFLLIQGTIFFLHEQF